MLGEAQPASSGSRSTISGKTFDNIYLAGKNGPQSIGKLKLADPGIGFQEAETKNLLTIPRAQIRKATWLRCSRDFELKIELDNGTIHKFDGFQRDSYDIVASQIKSSYGVTLEHRDLALRGYNWGKYEFQGNYMTFNVANKPAFEIPLADVAGATLSGKHEVSLELVNPIQRKDDGGGKPPRVREDMLVEVQFFIPGMVTASQVDDNLVDGKKLLRDKDSAPAVTANGKSREEGEINEEDEELVLGDDGEAITAASIFCETVKNRADVSVSQGDSIVGFTDLLCLTPRGRYEVDLYATFFRLRGKSHDYRILYSSIRRLFCLPKPDDLHYNFVIQLEPPLRQGQTRYPFLVFQMDRDEEVDATVKLDEATIEKQYEGRLKKEYDGPIFQVVGEVFKALTNIKVTIPGESFKSAQALSGLKCSLKANEAFLFPLEKSFISLPKPTTLILHSDITLITFGRVNASASSSTKTFEMRIATDSTEYTYSSIPREEYENLDAYCKSKKLKVTTDIGDGAPSYADEDDDDEDEVSDDSRGGRKRKRVPVDISGMADFDDEDESEDEDYVDKSEDDSDPDLEYDSDAGSQSESSEEEGDAEKSKKGKVKEGEKSKDNGKKAVKKDKDVSKEKKKASAKKSEEGPAKKKVKKEGDSKAGGDAKKTKAAASKKEKEVKDVKGDKIKSSEFVDSEDDDA
ncbi:FACT complex subunit [Dinochytrium kinnereticum]|nr:FACT complex subunit [Dinochytrium kinnereticum]